MLTIPNGASKLPWLLGEVSPGEAYVVAEAAEQIGFFSGEKFLRLFFISMTPFARPVS